MISVPKPITDQQDKQQQDQSHSDSGVEVQYRRVAICGTAPSSRMEANEQDPDTEIWALNDCYTFVENANRWFEIHERSVWEADGEEHVKFLKSFPSTIYMLQHWDDIPGSVQYPYHIIRDKFFPSVDLNSPDSLKNLMLGSTIDYMLALALCEGFGEIRVLGINMSSPTEYTHQLPSCNFWLGMIRGSGTKLYLPDSCPMLETPLYGAARRPYLTKEIIKTRLSRIYTQRRQTENSLNAVHGAIQALELLLSLLEEPKISLENSGNPDEYHPPGLNLNGQTGQEYQDLEETDASN